MYEYGVPYGCDIIKGAVFHDLDQYDEDALDRLDEIGRDEFSGQLPEIEANPEKLEVEEEHNANLRIRALIEHLGESASVGTLEWLPGYRFEGFAVRSKRHQEITHRWTVIFFALHDESVPAFVVEHQYTETLDTSITYMATGYFAPPMSTEENEHLSEALHRAADAHAGNVRSGESLD